MYYCCTCRFRLPTGSPDPTILFNFLGSDFNPFFTSVNTPRDDPQLAVGRLTVEGSGGRQLELCRVHTPCAICRSIEMAIPQFWKLMCATLNLRKIVEMLHVVVGVPVMSAKKLPYSGKFSWGLIFVVFADRQLSAKTRPAK